MRQNFKKMAVYLTVARLFWWFLAQQLTQTPYSGPTDPIGQNVPSISPITPFLLASTKFSDFELVTGSRIYASNGLYKNIEQSAILTPKSNRRVTVEPNLFAHSEIASWEHKLEANTVKEHAALSTLESRELGRQVTRIYYFFVPNYSRRVLLR